MTCFLKCCIEYKTKMLGKKQLVENNTEFYKYLERAHKANEDFLVLCNFQVEFESKFPSNWTIMGKESVFLAKRFNIGVL